MVRVLGKMDRTIYKAIIEENLFHSARYIGLGWRFSFQQDNDPKHTVQAELEKPMC